METEKQGISFHVAAHSYWNSLPNDVHNIELDLNAFKKRFKTFLFKSTFIGVFTVMSQSVTRIVLYKN